MTVEAAIAQLEHETSYRFAWKYYPDTIRQLIAASNARRVVEIGGGRFPFFNEGDVGTLGLSYTANDISARELAKAPTWAAKACFDVQSPDSDTITPFAGRFDFAFSKMVMEHVGSYRRAYTNLHRILTDGGLTVAFHPTLFAVPFVVNKLLPETLSDSVLKTAFPSRTDDGIPKFPATYDGCVVSTSVRQTLLDIGFSQVWQIPFFGHDYYLKIPLLHQLQERVANFAARRGIGALASYAYTIARK